MNIKKTRSIVILAGVLLVLIFSLPHFTLAIGQLTKPIVIKDILRGQEITELLTLINSEEKEIIYELKAEGDIENWTSFYKIDDKDLENPITEIEVSPESRIDAAVKFTIPDDTPNGQYSGQIVIVYNPRNDVDPDSTTASVLQKIGRDALITVTDKEIAMVSTTVIPLKYDIQIGAPLKFKVTYDNNGNVLVRPDLQLIITKGRKTVFNAIFPYPENEQAVKPRTQKTLPVIEWQTTGQNDGKYKAELKTIVSNNVLDEDSFRFNIGEVYENGGGFLSAIAFLGGGNLMLGWFVLGGFILFLVIIMILINKFRNNKEIINKKQNFSKVSNDINRNYKTRRIFINGKARAKKTKKIYI